MVVGVLGRSYFCILFGQVSSLFFPLVRLSLSASRQLFPPIKGLLLEPFSCPAIHEYSYKLSLLRSPLSLRRRNEKPLLEHVTGFSSLPVYRGCLLRVTAYSLGPECA